MYTPEQVELLLEQLHSMTIEFMHAGKPLNYNEICASIGYTPIDIGLTYNYNPDKE